VEIPPGLFFKLSVAEAAKRYLGLVKRKQTTQQIADALERGGFHHTSTRWRNTVYTALDRAAKLPNATIVKLASEWGLAEWYPTRVRVRTRPVNGKDAETGKAAGSTLSAEQQAEIDELIEQEKAQRGVGREAPADGDDIPF
jgi:hypothetical protein